MNGHKIKCQGHHEDGLIMVSNAEVSQNDNCQNSSVKKHFEHPSAL